MHESNLQSLWAKILRVTLCSPVLLATECGTAPADDSPKPDPSLTPITWELAPAPPLCTERTTIDLAGLNPNQAVDYLELGIYEISANVHSRRLQTIAGVECGNVADEAACKRSVNNQLASLCALHSSEPGYGYLPYLAVQEKDNLQILVSQQEVTTFLAPIDTAQEALLVAWKAQYNISCVDKNLGDARSIPGGYEVFATKGSGCWDDYVRYVLQVSSSGVIQEQSRVVLKPKSDNCVIGRRPAGLPVASTSQAGSGLGAYFADAARLEAASIVAFRILRNELRAHGAPNRLQQLARRAERDEIRHTRISAALARRYGGCPELPTVAPGPLRGLKQLAEENLIEGCVRETFGALVASFQAIHAKDAVLKAAMQGIAKDETRHAALSFQVAAWANRQLDRTARAELHDKMRQAISTLRSESSHPPEPALVLLAGLPTASEARSLLDQLEAELWSQAGS